MSRERFESYVRVGNGCWDWIGGISNTGYGAFWVDGKTVGAHRASYGFYRGQIPNGLMVLHKCDNRKCVNPEHLFLGTCLDNARDMVAKGRSCKGEAHKKAEAASRAAHLRGSQCPFAKLNESKVIEMRRLRASGNSLKDLSLIFGVRPATVSEVCSGRKWAHVPLIAELNK